MGLKGFVRQHVRTGSIHDIVEVLRGSFVEGPDQVSVLYSIREGGHSDVFAAIPNLQLAQVEAIYKTSESLALLLSYC